MSTDNGVSWQEARGAGSWFLTGRCRGTGLHDLSRAIDADDVIETPGGGVTITIDSTLPTTSGSLTTDETWSGVVTLTGDVTVPAGITLTIDAGTVVTALGLNDDQGGGGDPSRVELIVTVR